MNNHHTSVCWARNNRNRGGNSGNNNRGMQGSRNEAEQRQNNRSRSPTPPNQNSSTRRSVHFADQNQGHGPASNSVQAERMQEIDSILNTFYTSGIQIVACQGEENHKDKSLAWRHRRSIRCPKCSFFTQGNQDMQYYCPFCDEKFCGRCAHQETCAEPNCEYDRSRRSARVQANPAPVDQSTVATSSMSQPIQRQEEESIALQPVE